MDDDLEGMSREQLIAEARRLRAGIRARRDRSGHDLCWHHPALGLLPDGRAESQRFLPGRSSFEVACGTASHSTSSYATHRALTRRIKVDPRRDPGMGCTGSGGGCPRRSSASD
jgi:hypothetical protein